MKYTITYPIAVLLTQALFAGEPLIIDTQVQWEKALTTAKDVIIKDGTVSPGAKAGQFLQRRDANKDTKLTLDKLRGSE
jgi:hypothetical protein